MEVADIDGPAFVIKAEDLQALNFLEADHPQPLHLEWINRATNQKLRRTSIELLLRTLHHDEASPSVTRLHMSAGLRAVFETERERELFARAFAAACQLKRPENPHLVTAIFAGSKSAQMAVSQLIGIGIPAGSISMMWRVDEGMDVIGKAAEGHGKLGVAVSVAGGGVVGAAMGMAVLAIPGIGPVAAVGALAASVLPQLAAVSAAIGATGGAIARMLTDNDVDGREANYLEQQIRQGNVLVSVDTQVAEGQGGAARDVLMRSGGRTEQNKGQVLAQIPEDWLPK